MTTTSLTFNIGAIDRALDRITYETLKSQQVCAMIGFESSKCRDQTINSLTFVLAAGVLSYTIINLLRMKKDQSK